MFREPFASGNFSMLASHSGLAMNHLRFLECGVDLPGATGAPGAPQGLVPLNGYMEEGALYARGSGTHRRSLIQPITDRTS